MDSRDDSYIHLNEAGYFFSLIKCYKKGFVLSILAASKWLLAYVLTLIIFPRVKPLVEGIIDSMGLLSLF